MLDWAAQATCDGVAAPQEEQKLCGAEWVADWLPHCGQNMVKPPGNASAIWFGK
jgi:hypothetical protein